MTDTPHNGHILRTIHFLMTPHQQLPSLHVCCLVIVTLSAIPTTIFSLCHHPCHNVLVPMNLFIV